MQRSVEGKDVQAMRATYRVPRSARFPPARGFGGLLAAMMLLSTALISPPAVLAGPPAAQHARPLAQLSQGVDLGNVEIEPNGTTATATSLSGSNLKLTGNLFP